MVGYRHDQGEVTVSVSNRQRPTTVHYGHTLESWFVERFELALAHFRGTVPQLQHQVAALLQEAETHKPVPPTATASPPRSGPTILSSQPGHEVPSDGWAEYASVLRRGCTSVQAAVTRHTQDQAEASHVPSPPEAVLSARLLAEDAEAIATVAAFHAQLAAITPPTSLARLHEHVLAALVRLSDGLTALQQGVVNHDEERRRAGAEEVQQAAAVIQAVPGSALD
jgi:hypothetical protein